MAQRSVPVRPHPRRGEVMSISEASLRNHFAALALERDEALRNAPQALRASWPQAQVMMIDAAGRCAGDDAGPYCWDGETLGDQVLEAASFLGRNRGQPAWFALPLAQLPTHLEPPSRWVDLWHAAAHWSRFDSAVFAYAKALLLWQMRARFCGTCGAPTRPERAGHCMRCSNPDCDLPQFPRTDAAIIVCVQRGARVLLGRQASWAAGRWSALAGFVEPGESLEDAVRREVDEEVGVALGAVQYHSSQPWPFPGALMLGFQAQARSDVLRLGDELEAARWFEADELVQAVRAGEASLPPAISISRQLIEDWLASHLGRGVVERLRGVT